jgi:hypothetical protein
VVASPHRWQTRRGSKDVTECDQQIVEEGVAGGRSCEARCADGRHVRPTDRPAVAGERHGALLEVPLDPAQGDQPLRP